MKGVLRSSLSSFAVTRGRRERPSGVSSDCRVHVPMRAGALERPKGRSFCKPRGFDRGRQRFGSSSGVAGTTCPWVAEVGSLDAGRSSRLFLSGRSRRSVGVFVKRLLPRGASHRPNGGRFGQVARAPAPWESTRYGYACWILEGIFRLFPSRESIFGGNAGALGSLSPKEARASLDAILVWRKGESAVVRSSAFASP